MFYFWFIPIEMFGVLYKFFIAKITVFQQEKPQPFVYILLSVAIRGIASNTGGSLY